MTSIFPRLVGFSVQDKNSESFRWGTEGYTFSPRLDCRQKHRTRNWTIFWAGWLLSLNLSRQLRQRRFFGTTSEIFQRSRLSFGKALYSSVMQHMRWDRISVKVRVRLSRMLSRSALTPMMWRPTTTYAPGERTAFKCARADPPDSSLPVALPPRAFEISYCERFQPSCSFADWDRTSTLET